MLALPQKEGDQMKLFREIKEYIKHHPAYSLLPDEDAKNEITFSVVDSFASAFDIDESAYSADEFAAEVANEIMDELMGW